jgi:hypothetical protein
MKYPAIVRVIAASCFSILLFAMQACGVVPATSNSSTAVSGGNSSVVPAGTRQVTVSLSSDMKAPFRSDSTARQRSTSALATLIIAATPSGSNFTSVGTSGSYVLNLPTNLTYSLFIAYVYPNNVTDYQLIQYGDRQSSFRLAPGTNGDLSAINLGTLAYDVSNSNQILSSVIVDSFIDSRYFGVTNDLVKNTNFFNHGDGVVDCFGCLDMNTNGIPDALEVSNFSNTGGIPDHFTKRFLTNTNSAYYCYLVATLAANPRADFYKGTGIWSNLAVDFALNTNYQSFYGDYPEGYSNIFTTVALDTNFADLIPSALVSNWSNAQISVTLDTNFLSSINPGELFAWSNTLVNVSLNPDYTNLFLPGQLTILSNRISTISTNSNFSVLIPPELTNQLRIVVTVLH